MYEHRNLFIDEAIVIVKHILILALGVGSSLRARRKVIQLTVPSEKHSCNIFGWLASAAPPGALDMNCTRVGLSLATSGCLVFGCPCQLSGSFLGQICVQWMQQQGHRRELIVMLWLAATVTIFNRVHVRPRECFLWYNKKIWPSKYGMTSF